MKENNEQKEINELFVSYQIALKLKELGFNEKCLGYFNSKGKFNFADCSRYTDIPFYYKNSKCETWLSTIFSTKKTKSKICVAPLWQQVIDWFREKYKLYILVEPNITGNWQFSIYKLNNGLLFGQKSLFIQKELNYYESREQAILKAIELCKNN